MIVTTSDLHLQPGEIMPRLLGTKAVLVGDIIEIIPWGIGAWKTPVGRRTIKSIAESGDIEYIIGNHEGREAWVRELFKDYPNIKVKKELNLTINGRHYRFKHGHQFAFDWKILNVIADDVTSFMCRTPLRGLWYGFCRWVGWMPGSIVEEESRRYQSIVASIWAAALKEAHSEPNMTLVIGHTHQACHITTEFGAELIDLGKGNIEEIR